METPISITAIEATETTAANAGYRLVQYWTPDRNPRKEAIHKWKAKKHREFLRDYELCPTGKSVKPIYDIEESFVDECEEEEKIENHNKAQACLETAKNILTLLEELPSDDPTVTELLLQCPQIKSNLSEFITTVKDTRILRDLLSNYERMVLVS